MRDEGDALALVWMDVRCSPSSRTAVILTSIRVRARVDDGRVFTLPSLARPSYSLHGAHEIHPSARKVARNTSHFTLRPASARSNGIVFGRSSIRSG